MERIAEVREDFGGKTWFDVEAGGGGTAPGKEGNGYAGGCGPRRGKGCGIERGSDQRDRIGEGKRLLHGHYGVRRRFGDIKQC